MSRSLPTTLSAVALCVILTVVLGCESKTCTALAAANAPLPETTAVKAPFDMPKMQRPIFPSRIFDICDFGAVGDGRSMNTGAFAATIAACAKAGGGEVRVPPGIWLTGPIHLKSNINLHIEKAAEIRFSTNFADYLPAVFTRYEGIECYNYSPLIYAKGCTNIAITGSGKINGRGKPWWHWSKRSTDAAQRLYDMAYRNVAVKDRVFGTEADALRPAFLEPINCRNILLEGFKITDGPMWTIHPVYCENVIVRNVTVKTNGPNGDGVNPDSCKNVLIENCSFDTSDDAIAIKSGKDDDGWRVGRPCENIVIRHCRFGLGTPCDGVLSIGSDMSGSVRNVYIHDCDFDLTQRAVRVKSKRGRGGTVENVWLENITVGRVRSDALLLNTFYGSDATAPYSKKPPTFRNINVKNLSCSHTKRAIRIVGLPEMPIENITLENISISAEKGLSCSDAKAVKLTNLDITPTQGPVILLKNCRDVTIAKSTCAKTVTAFLKLEGEKTENIRLLDNNLSNAQKDVILNRDVPAGVYKVW